MNRGPSLPFELVVLGLLLLALAFAWPWISAWTAADVLRGLGLVPLVAGGVQTSAPTRAPDGCVLPTESERLVIIFWWHEGRLAHRCLFAGSRGTYSRTRP